MRDWILPTSRQGLLMAGLLAIGAGLVYRFPDALGEPKRWIVLLLSLGFFGAPHSPTRLNLHAWLAATALVSWLARIAAIHGLGLGPILVLSFFGAALAVRGGERAWRYYLPEIGGNRDIGLRQEARRAFLTSLLLFLVVFVADGFRKQGIYEGLAGARFARLALLFLSGVGFVRFLSLQSDPAEKGIGAPWSVRASGKVVPAQRWPYLVFVAVVGWSPASGLLLQKLGQTSGRSLHLTSGLLMLLATAVFLLALVRLRRRREASAGSVRWASFVAGILLAHSLFAYLSGLGYRVDPVGEGFISDRAAEGIQNVHIVLVTFFLIVLPFVHARTRLLRRYPRLAYFVAPPVLSVMNAPLAAINGSRWHHASTGFLFFVTALIVGHYLRAAFEEKERHRLYLLAVLLLILAGGYLDAVAADPVKNIYKLFFASCGFALFAVDLFERVGES